MDSTSNPPKITAEEDYSSDLERSESSSPEDQKCIEFHHYAEGPKPAELHEDVHIGSIARSGVLDDLINGDEIVIPDERRIFIYIKYPLGKPARFAVRADNPQVGFTRKELLAAIGVIYQQVYKTEEETWSRAPVSTEFQGVRPASDGKYGIWGYDLDALYLLGITYNPERQHWEVHAQD